MTNYTLFLDDLRDPVGLPGDIIVARTVAEAQAIVRAEGLPRVISFDHDLGENEIAMEFMWWLIDGDIDDLWDLNEVDQVVIHSANPVGSLNLIGLWDGYSKSELISKVMALHQPRA